MLDSNFYPKLTQVAEELNMNPRDLLLIMYSESGLDPQAKNPEGAYGLIQFVNSTLHGMGLSKQDILNSSASKQLDYVKQYVQSQAAFIGHPFHSATEYYHANFFPLTLKRWHGTDPEANRDVVVVSSTAKSPQERQAYSHNSGLDFNHDGVITVGDLTDYLMSRAKSKGFQQALEKLNQFAGSGHVSELSPNKTFSNESNKSNESNWLSTLINKLMNFMSSLASNKEIGTLIVLGAEDPVAKLEFAEILKLALQEELNISASIHQNHNQIELLCLATSKNKDLEIKELTSALIEVFAEATQKINSPKIYYKLLSNMSSNYPELDIKVSEINHRKFLLKFATDRSKIENRS